MKRKQAYRGKLRPWTLKFSILTIAWLCLSVNFTAYAQLRGADSVARGQLPSGLQIGDEIPKELWNERFKVVNHPKGKDSITLNDYKGKLIILDFWATWCGSCIKYLPAMHNLQETYGTRILVLPVTYESMKKVSHFATKNKVLNGIDKFLSIVENKSLKTFFPSKTIPHAVIIGTNGIVKSITLPQYITGEKIDNLLQGKKTSFPQKKEQLEKSLLNTLNEFPVGKNAYSVTLTGYLEGFTHINMVIAADSSKGRVRYYFINKPVLNAYAAALGSGLPYLPNRRILKVKDTTLYISESSGSNPVHLNKTTPKRYVSYETIVPMSLSGKEVRKILKQHLDHFLKLEGTIERRKVPCLVLTCLNSNNTVITSGGEEVISLNEGTPNFIRNTKLSDLVYALNRIPGMPPVLDETGFSDAVDMDLPDQLTDIRVLTNTLKEYGFGLRWQTRELDMFVLRETCNPETNSTQRPNP